MISAKPSPQPRSNVSEPKDGNANSEDLPVVQLKEQVVRELRRHQIPANKVQEIAGRLEGIVVHQIEEFHQGPLPPPRQLAEYADVVSGGAERIFAMAEREQEHRHDCERRIVRGEIRLKHVGQGAALLALVLMLVLLAYMVSSGAAVQAAALGGVLVAAVIASFLAPAFFASSASSGAVAKASTPKQNPQRKNRGGRR